MLWPYCIRLLNEKEQPVSCTTHPGPREEAVRCARRLLRESEYRHAEVCSVRHTNWGTETGIRLELVTRDGAS